ncbi:MAG TPA: hypothetical protein VF469_00895 [Kofleriaceae bacterium]
MSSEPEPRNTAPRSFSIAHGPSRRLLARLHLVRADGSPRAALLVVVAWLPLLASDVLRVATGQPHVPIVLDLSVHTRLLIGIPLLVAAERILEQRCGVATGQLYAGNFAERTTVDRIFDRAVRLRDSRLAELAILALAILGGQALLWGLVGPTGLFAGISDGGGLSFARLWYAIVAWPIAQFLLLRWIWHWSIWSYIIVRLSRLPLATIATHPDHAAGIGFLGEPIHGFSSFALAISTLLASTWATRIVAGRATAQTFVPEFIVFLVLAVLLACGPLVLFMGMLYRARQREIARYNALALDYVRAFHRKWIEERSDAVELLGTADLQSLNDLGGAFASLEDARLVPFGPRLIVSVLVAAVIPMLPLVATVMPLDELLRRIGKALLGLPG